MNRLTGHTRALERRWEKNSPEAAAAAKFSPQSAPRRRSRPINAVFEAFGGSARTACLIWGLAKGVVNGRLDSARATKVSRHETRRHQIVALLRTLLLLILMLLALHPYVSVNDPSSPPHSFSCLPAMQRYESRRHVCHPLCLYRLSSSTPLKGDGRTDKEGESDRK